jgi:VWFA-related protein
MKTIGVGGKNTKPAAQSKMFEALGSSAYWLDPPRSHRIAELHFPTRKAQGRAATGNRTPCVLLMGLLMSVATSVAYAHAVEAPGRAEQTESPAARAHPEYSLAVESPLVTIDVLVTDQEGNVLTGLGKQNFRVLDNGRPQAITGFSPSTEPITIVMLLEYSGLSYNYFAYKSAAWGLRFLDYLEANDWVAVVTYDIKPTVRVDFTHSMPEVEQVLHTLSFPQFREANIFDALLETLDQLEPVKGKRAILLIGTGEDTFSKITLDDVYNRLKQTSVTVFCIGVAESEYLNAELRGAGNTSYLQIKNQLLTFATMTGGFAWFPRFEGELPSIFRSVGGALRNQYELSFSPPRGSRDAKYHKLKVEVVGQDGKPLQVRDKNGRSSKVSVYARQGYMAPEAND